MPRAIRAPASGSFPVGQVVLVDDLSGGVRLGKAKTQLQADQSVLLQNFSLEESGNLRLVEGYTKLSTSSLGARRCQGGQRIYQRSNTFSLVGDNGNVYTPTDGGVWGSADVTSLHTTNEMHFPYDRNIAAVFDGSNVPQITTDGTTWYPMGIVAPSVVPSLAASSGGTLLNANDYEVSYTYKSTDTDYGVESDDSGTAEITISNPNNTVAVTCTFSADAKVDTVVVYARNTTTGQSVRRQVGTGVNPGSGTVVISFSTEPLATASEVPIDNGQPLAFKIAVAWKNRWWAFHPTLPNRLHFSEVFEPQIWPADFFIDLPLHKGDTLTAEAPIGDILTLFGESGIFLVIGQTSLDFEVRPALSVQGGALGSRAVQVVEGSVVHADATGVNIFDGATDRFLSLDIETGWRDMIKNADQADLGLVDVTYNTRLKQVQVAVPRLYPTGVAGEWVLDLNRSRELERDAWFSTTRAIGGYIYWDGNEPTTGNTHRLFSWNTTTAELYEERTGTDADGANLTAIYASPAFSTQLREAVFPEAFVEFEPNSGTLTVTPFVDGVSQGSQTVNIGTGLSLYGTGVYGTATYGSSARQTQPLVLPLSAEGKNFSIRIQYDGQARYRHFGFGFVPIAEPAMRGI